ACKSSRPEPEPSEPSVPPAAQGAGEVNAEQQLGEDAQKLTLADQRRAFLFEQHIANAKSLMSGLRLDDARTEVDAALELEPDNLQAKNLRAQILSLKGEAGASTQTIT